MEEVRKVDLFVQDTFFRHFDMYKYSLVYKDELALSTTQTFSFAEPKKPEAIYGSNTQKALFEEVKELRDYFSEDEQLAIKKKLEFFASPEGRAQKVLDAEMERIGDYLDAQMRKQDEDLLAKVKK